VQFQLSWAVWDWLSTSRRISNAGKDSDIQKIGLQKKVRQLRSDIQSQLQQYEVLDKSIENARRVVSQSELQTEYSRSMYQLGRINLLQAQRSIDRLFAARLSLTNRLKDRYLLAAKLLVQCGFNIIPDHLDSFLVE
jgi:outer membrane protein TolC